MFRGLDVQNHGYLTITLDVSSQLYCSVILTLENKSSVTNNNVRASPGYDTWKMWRSERVLFQGIETGPLINFHRIVTVMTELIRLRILRLHQITRFIAPTKWKTINCT
jgi:hypothetical protein